MNLGQLNVQLQDHFLKTISSFKASKPNRTMVKSLKRHVPSNNPNIEEGCVTGVQDKIDENNTFMVQLEVSNPIHNRKSLEVSLPTNYSVETTKCLICQEDFTAQHNSKRRLDDHLNKQHGILVSGKLNMCGFCHYSNHSLNNIMHHMTIKHWNKFEDGAGLIKLILLPEDDQYENSDEDSHKSHDSWEDCPTY